jgi:hypothetical protein
VADRNIYAGFFNRAILGARTLEDNIFEAVRQTVRDLGGRIIGECVVDGSGTGLEIVDDAAAINERKLTVEGNLPCLSDSGEVFIGMGSNSALVTSVEGSRTIVLHDPAWFEDLPYENDDGTTYRVYLHNTRFPIDVGIGDNGSRGYSRWVDAPGVTVAPSAVSDGGSGLRLRVTTGLTGLGVQEWLTSNDEDDDWSYDCIVYLDTDVAGVTISDDDPDVAIAFGAKLTRLAIGGWVVDITGIGDGYLGQASPSLVAARYKIVVLGPVITTTNFDSNRSYIFLGTVESDTVAEIIDMTGQHVIESVSQTLNDLSGVPETVIAKGWTDRPTLTINADDLDIGVGEAYVDGAITVTSLDTVGPFAPSSTTYVYWDNTAPGWDFSTSFSTAAGASAVPAYRVETDGASQITLVTTIMKMVNEFNEQLVLSVSGTSAHRAMFNTLEGALAFAAALNTTATNRRGYVIELLGNVTVSASISDADLVGVPNVTFRARGGRMIASSAGAAIDGSKVAWSFDDPLFRVASGATLRNWRFEGVYFDYNGTGTAADTAVVANFGDVDGLEFVECTVDGNDVLGSNVYLPHVVYSEANEVKRLTFDRCRLYSAESVLWVTAAAEASSFLLVRDCVVENDSAATVLSQAGFLTDIGAAGGTQTKWTIRGNKGTALQGNGIRSRKLSDSRIHDNDLDVTGNFSVVHLGNDSDMTDVVRINIRDNFFRRNDGTTAPLMKLTGADTTSAFRTCWFIHDNLIDGRTAPAGSVGIDLNVDDIVGLGETSGNNLIHDNAVVNVETGITVKSLHRSLVHSNVVVAEAAGIAVSMEDECTVSVYGNVIALDGADPSGIVLDAQGGTDERGFMAFGNVIDMVDAASGTPIGINCLPSGASSASSDSPAVFALNVILGDSGLTCRGLLFQGSTAVVIGNVMRDCGVRFDEGLGGVDSSEIVFALNILESGDDVTGDDISGSAFVGNVLTSGNFTFELAAHMVVTGNHINNAIFGIDGGTGGGVVLTGNMILNNIGFDTPDGQDSVIVGNVVGGTMNDGVASQSVVAVGNYWTDTSAAHSFSVLSGVYVGNKFNDDVTLEASSINGVFVGNRIDGSLTNSGGDTVANNDT